MGREKPQPEPEFKTFEEADQTLMNIRGIEGRLATLQASHDHKLAKLRDEHQERAEPLLGQKKNLEKGLLEFAVFNREFFEKKKTWPGAHGEMGFRLSTKVVFRRGFNGDKVVGLLKKMGLKRCIHIKETPDKEAMRNLTAEQIARVGASVKSEDGFWYETKKDLPAENPKDAA